MIKHRVREIVIGITIVMLISSIGLYTGTNKIEMEKGVTGYAFLEEKHNRKDVVIAGLEFTVDDDNRFFYYMFADDNKWYESNDELKWEYRADMGDDLWKGLYYLKSYDAKIYFNGDEIKDMVEFARKMR